MKAKLSLVVLPLVSLAIGVTLGTLSMRGVGSGSERLAHGQLAGGMGVVTAPARGGGPSAPAPSGGSAPAGRVNPGLPPTSGETARALLAQHRGQETAPLVQGLQNNPGVLSSVMDMIRNDPALRNQALERMKQSGGLVGMSGSAIGEEALNGALNSLAADPQRLQSILNFIGQNPQLMQGMLGQMGLPNVSAEEINAAFGQLGKDPALLGRLARGDKAAVDQLADQIAGQQSAGQGAEQGGRSGLNGLRPEELARLYEQMQAGGGAAPAGGLPANGVPGLGGLAGGLGMGGDEGSPAPGGAIPPGWAMQQGGAPPQMLGTDLLGTGASLSVLADMLGVFGGGSQMGRLQSSLRQGDLQALLAMVHEIYGPNGTLARDPSLGLPHGADSYTDLLESLMKMGDE